MLAEDPSVFGLIYILKFSCNVSYFIGQVSKNTSSNVVTLCLGAPSDVISLVICEVCPKGRGCNGYKIYPFHSIVFTHYGLYCITFIHCALFVSCLVEVATFGCSSVATV